MPRGLKRYQTEGSWHFITFSCYRRKPYLDTDFARITFEEQLESLRARHRFLVFGYVLMPEHVHLLLSEPKAQPLATSLNVLKAETSRRLKDERKQFWQTRYYDFNLVATGKFGEKLQYMHRNPVVRGLVETPEEWPWSSYHHWLTGERGRVLIESHWEWRRREREAMETP